MPLADTHSGSHADQLIEGLFRGYFSKAVASLTRILGTHHIELAEEVVQESLLRALQAWRIGGIPPQPEGWLYRTAKNLAIDALRREKNFERKTAAITYQLESSFHPAYEVQDDMQITDDRLKLLFIACHPLLSYEVQLCFTLKIACGLSVEEIARAFLSTPDTIAQRIVRAKRRIRESDLPFELPPPHELSQRIDAVLHVIYLLFNEGYGAMEGDQLIREDLCTEAIGLMAMLLKHPVGNVPDAHALMSLLLLQASRIPARTDDSGAIVLLADQDRTKWDRQMIQMGMHHLAQARGGAMSTYHLQAGIAAIHCLSPGYEATNWKDILWYYDELMRTHPGPVFALNRAIALSFVQGEGAALAALRALHDEPKLKQYYLYYATLGEMYMQCGNRDNAIEAYIEALSLVRTVPERQLLLQKLERCKAAVQ